MRKPGFLFFFIFFSALIMPGFALAESTLFFSDIPKQIEEGDRITVEVKINSKDQPINAISGSVYFPTDLLKAVSVSKEKSIINFWTIEPKLVRDRVSFEGVILNPGFQSGNGLIMRILFEAKNPGLAVLNWSEGAVLANDGLGTNVLATLNSANLKIIRKQSSDGGKVIVEGPVRFGATQKKIVALPVITDYPKETGVYQKFELKGKGEPNMLTKIVFKDVSAKSIGERFIEILLTKRKKLDEALVKNNSNGIFEYTSPNNLVAGVYNATPFLVDETNNIEKPGFGAQLLVRDSRIVKSLVVVINVLGLLIPIVTLCVIIYFIPWYSWLRMRVLKKKIGLEEEKLELSGHEIKRQAEILDKTVDQIINTKNAPENKN